MTGSVYESNKEFVEKLNSVRDDFQAELDTAKVIANICTIIIFIVISDCSDCNNYRKDNIRLNYRTSTSD